MPKNGGGTGNEWLIFENDGEGNFKKHEVYKGYGGHETIFADFDADGDIDIVSKCWCKPTTFVLLENKLDPPQDATPPSAPTNVHMALTQDLDIELSWDEVTDSESGVKKYTIYRDNVQIGTAEGTTYTDNSVEVGETYQYSISATNGAGLEGDKSESTTSIENLRDALHLSSFKIRTSRSSSGLLLTIATDIKGKHSIALIDMQGKVLAEQENSGLTENSFSISGRSNGVYFIRVSVQESSVVKKILLDRS